MARSTRSQFIVKLHSILEAGQHPNDLRWISPNSFEVTSEEGRAIAALTAWDFKSLSSFIRQLSYYGFKRLSDRRRASERRGAAANSIIFTHPSGCFLRGDATPLDQISRKTRVRKGSATRTRQLSQDSLEQSASPPQYQTEFDEGFHPHARRESSVSEYSNTHQLREGASGPQWAPAPPPVRSKQVPQLQGAPMGDWPGRNGSSYPNSSLSSAPSNFPHQYPAYYYQPHPSPVSNHDGYFNNPAPFANPSSNGPPYANGESEAPVHARGAIIAPPSPSDSYGSASPRRSEPAEEQHYFDRRLPPNLHFHDRTLHRARSLDSGADRMGDGPHGNDMVQPYFHATGPPFNLYESQSQSQPQSLRPRAATEVTRDRMDS